MVIFFTANGDVLPASEASKNSKTLSIVHIFLNPKLLWKKSFLPSLDKEKHYGCNGLDYSGYNLVSRTPNFSMLQLGEATNLTTQGRTRYLDF